RLSDQTLVRWHAQADRVLDRRGHRAIGDEGRSDSLVSSGLGAPDLRRDGSAGMSTSDQRIDLTRPRAPRALVIPALAVTLVMIAGVATASAVSDVAIRYVAFAAMVAALASGVVAVRRGTPWVRAVSAIVAVLALMLGSTFFGLTYS